MPTSRRIRRIAGLLSARLPELRLEQVADSRASRGKRWRLPQLLGSVLVGMMAGCKSLLEVEALTAELSVGARRLLGIARRVPDTTLRRTLCALDISALRAVLRRAVHAAWRRKALEPCGLPCGVVAMDGKVTSLPAWDDAYIQRSIDEAKQRAIGLMRTITCTLSSSPARPCIDVVPIPADSNEVGHFATAFAELVENFGGLFRVVTYNAGGASEANGRAVVAAGKDYVLRLNNEQWLIQRFATEVLAHKPSIAETRDVVTNQVEVVRRLRLVRVNRTSLTRGESAYCWEHAKTLLAVTSERHERGTLVSRELRYYAASLEHDALSGEQWLLLIRSHWAVEVTHFTLDTAFAEDDHPFIEYDGRGALAALVLRRIAYCLLALFRAVTLRSDENRRLPWRDILSWVALALHTATQAHVANLPSHRLTKACL